jgi:hypothetical protein
MKFSGSLGIIMALAFLQSAVAQGSQDTMWICRDTTPDTLWFKMNLADTFPDNRGQFDMVDTGTSLNSSYYVNFNYQFSSDSVFLKGKDPTSGADTIFHCAPRPGYAGFKFYWDGGATQFWVQEYDSLIFWHKGPLPGHKVRMIWAQGSAGCGTPINYELMGEFKSSTDWKRESFSFPKKRNYGAAPDSQFVKIGLFELRMQIYNDSAVGTSPTSAAGNLKIDNMFFFKAPAHFPEIWEQPGSQTFTVGSQVFLRVIALGGSGNAGEMTYVWKKNGNPIAETTYRYVIDPAQSGDAGTYTVTVTNSLGNVTSDAAILTVKGESEKKGCGCGSGTGLALIPPLFYKAMAHRKRKKKNPAT